jgi:rubrerythrin
MKIASSRFQKWMAAARPYEVLTLAVRMEQGAVRRYAAMAKAATNRLAAAKFRYLAAEEREHARVLAALRQKLRRPRGATLPPIAVSEVAGAGSGDTPVAALQWAIRSEEEAQRFYRLCAKRSRRAAVRRLFERLADQERRHALTLTEELTMLRGAFAWSSIEGNPPVEEDFWIQG